MPTTHFILFWSLSTFFPSVSFSSSLLAPCSFSSPPLFLALLTSSTFLSSHLVFLYFSRVHPFLYRSPHFLLLSFYLFRFFLSRTFSAFQPLLARLPFIVEILFKPRRRFSTVLPHNLYCLWLSQKDNKTFKVIWRFEDSTPSFLQFLFLLFQWEHTHCAVFSLSIIHTCLVCFGGDCDLFRFYLQPSTVL